MILADSWGRPRTLPTQTQKVHLDSIDFPVPPARAETVGPSTEARSACARREFHAMDFLILARRDASTKHHTLRYYIRLARQHGLSESQVAAGLGRSPEEVAQFLSGGCH